MRSAMRPPLPLSSSCPGHRPPPGARRPRSMARAARQGYPAAALGRTDMTPMHYATDFKSIKHEVSPQEWQTRLRRLDAEEKSSGYPSYKH